MNDCYCDNPMTCIFTDTPSGKSKNTKLNKNIQIYPLLWSIWGWGCNIRWSVRWVYQLLKTVEQFKCQVLSSLGISVVEICPKNSKAASRFLAIHGHINRWTKLSTLNILLSCLRECLKSNERFKSLAWLVDLNYRDISIQRYSPID